MFGIFRLLGYRFSPRIADIADIGDIRYWRAHWPADPPGDYGPLNAIARNRVNLAKISQHWPDMLRVVGSLLTHQVRVYDLLRMLGRDGHPAPHGQAFAEYGRIAKTLHLLAMIDPIDDTHRRTVNTQTTVQESRHTLARTICHGKTRPDLPGLPRRPGRSARRARARRQTPSCCGIPAISTPRSTHYASRDTGHENKTLPGCPHSGTPTSTARPVHLPAHPVGAGLRRLRDLAASDD